MAAEKSIDELLNEVQEVDCKIPFGQLKLNVPYVVRSVERSSAIIGGRTVLGVLARILSPEGMALFTYLPSSFKKLDDRVLQKVNSDFLAGQSWSVVNYGMIGSAGIGKLHKPGEGIDSQLANRMKSFEGAKEAGQVMSNQRKRPRSEDDAV